MEANLDIEATEGRPAGNDAHPWRRPGWLLWVVVLGLIVIFGALLASHTGNARPWRIVDNVGETLAALFAVAACVVRATRPGRSRQRAREIPWLLLALGAGCWAASQLGWFYYEVVLGRNAPEPSALDAVDLAAYLVVGCGLLAMVRTPAGALSHFRGAVEALFIGAGCLFCSWALFIGSVLAHGEALTYASVVNLAYPVLDAVLLATVLFVAVKLWRRRPAGLGPLSAGLVVWAIADSWYWYVSNTSSNPPAVSAAGAGWFAGYLLIGMGALQRPTRRRERRQLVGRRAQLALPVLPALAGATIVLVRWASSGNVDSPVSLLVIASAMSALGVGLLLLVTFENHALTVDLENRVEQRTAELEERTAELRRTERYYRAVVQNSSDIVMVLDTDLVIRDVSDAAVSMFGMSATSLVGTNLQALGEGDVSALVEALARVAMNPDQDARVEWKLTDGSGRVRRVESTIANLVGDPDVGGFVLNTRDDTERALLAEQMRDQAFHDPLTGLANRALLSDRASQAFARGVRNGGQVAILAIDLDAFKLVNDGYGHKTGDELLCTVSERLRAVVRPEDTVARLGGDEFVVLVESIADVEEALRLAERIRDSVRADVLIGGTEHRVSASVGVAIGRSPETNFDQLLSDADVALYYVKGTGRNAVQLFQSRMYQDSRRRLELQTELRNAIESGELCLHYQPEFDAAGDELQGFEALVRWDHPTRGLIPPPEFIPLAEETGLVVPLGRWVLGEALRQATAWSAENEDARDLTIAVNVSALQLSAPTIVADVQQALMHSAIEPRRVVLELTESAFIDISPAILGKLQALKQLGVRLAIDDFGTGYASVSALQGMPIDILKIDRSFIAAIDDGAHGNDLLEAIVNIGHALRLATIAEGIESDRQLETTRRLGCTFTQGFLLSRPLEAKDAGSMIRALPKRSVDTGERGRQMPGAEAGPGAAGKSGLAPAPPAPAQPVS